MKDIFDLMREQINRSIYSISLQNNHGVKFKAIDVADVENIINEAEAKRKEKEAELRANVIDEFAEAIMVKATELSEKVVFDGKLVCDALSLDCVSDMVLEIALDMKGEKE